MPLDPLPWPHGIPEKPAEGKTVPIEVEPKYESVYVEMAIMKRNCWRKPGHGPCCTCQRCGKNYDDCRCSLDDVGQESGQFKRERDEAWIEIARLKAIVKAYMPPHDQDAYPKSAMPERGE